jgi:hypothetical protein
MNRLSALTLKYDSSLDKYLNQEGIEFTKGTCPQLKNQKVVWVSNYDKSFYQFMFENDLIPLANFRAYYFEEGIISVTERNYLEHKGNSYRFETHILSEWMPEQEEII